MIKVILIIIVVLLAAVLIYAATKPDTFRIRRTISIKAPPDKIFPLINDFHSFGAWSPYEKKDPAMKRTFSGAGNGKGAVYEWENDRNVGEGRMEITDTSPPSQVTINWISSSRLSPTTLLYSRWTTQASPRTSHGRCMGPVPTLRR